MTILKDFEEKIKAHKEELFLALLITLCLLIGFGLGRLSKLSESKTPISIELPQKTLENSTSSNAQNDNTEKYLASKNGTKYYLPWCDGVKKIAEKNLIEFKSREEAEMAGFSKAANCPGLQ